MIIARAPLRVSLAGGGTDLPWFEKEHGANIIATTIDKYVTVIVHERWDAKIRVAYRKHELVDDPSQLENPLLREALAFRSGLEVHSIADIPANTGLGSSGAFMVALVAALDAFSGERSSALQLANRAFELEQRVDPNTGWQDHFVAAFGGTRQYESSMSPSGKMFAPGHGYRIEVEGLDSLELWFTGRTRQASEVLAAQATERNLEAMRLLGALVHDVAGGRHIGEIFDRHHQLKIATAVHAVSSNEIEDHRRAALEAGAIGVKLVGAGGGGFLLVSMPSDGGILEAKRTKVREVLTERGLRHVPVRFGVPGVEVQRW